MDVFTHAMAGAATGAAFGRPLLGAVVAVLPDSALWLGPRRASPPALYRAAHGLLVPFMLAAITLPLFGPQVSGCVLFAWLSHFVLDLPTHGEEWAPRPFWPDDRHVFFTHFEEWEWFNASWWRGLKIAIIWSISWLSLSSFVTGFRFLRSVL